MQAGITGERQTPAQHQLIVAALATIVGLARAYQFHAMIARAQAITQLAKSIGDTIDFRGEGFGDQGDMQGCGHDPSVSGGHDAHVSR